MNKIILDGIIWNIRDSHKVLDTQYQKANLTYKTNSGKDSVITLMFKKFQCQNKDGDRIQLSGNIRSFSEKLGDKNKVSIYVYTYFDSPTEEEQEMMNSF